MKNLMELRVNGWLYELAIDPKRTLLEVLREDLGLCGSKEGCGTGECGACTVIVDEEPLLSCLSLAVRCRGKEILTIEGIATPGKLHPLQEAFVECGGTQCGFCTPGMIMSAKALLDRNRNPSREEVKWAISGNLCRCTGYKKIIDAIELAAQRMIA